MTTKRTREREHHLLWQGPGKPPWQTTNYIFLRAPRNAHVWLTQDQNTKLYKIQVRSTTDRPIGAERLAYLHGITQAYLEGFRVGQVTT